MTDGGDGAREEPDVASVEQTPLDDARTNGSTAEPEQARSTSAEVSDRGQPATESVLAEPTRTRLAKAQAHSSQLERGPISEYTTDRRSLASAVRVQWGIRTTVFAFVVGMIVTAVLRGLSAPAVFGLAAVGLLLGLGLVWVLLAYRVWVYQIRDDSLYLERGVVTHVRTIVPYVRIQHVDTSRSALERALGLSTLVVYTAGSRGADVSVPGLKPHEARDLQQRLKELAIEADGDDAL
jgi:membrane protein YdbS with pleckstrin-like domain